LLRYDWIVAIVLGICFVKKEHFITAGLCFGYAALMRYFPAIWMLGIFAKAVHALIFNRAEPLSRLWRRIPDVYYRMAAGFFAIVIVISALSVMRDGGATTRASIDNMSGHLEAANLSSRRMGMAIAAAYRGETEMLLINNAKRALVGELKPWVTSLGLMMSVLLGVFLTRRKSPEAIALGLLPFFWLTTSSYYYYVARLTGVIIHAQDLTKARNVFGLFMLFLMEFFSNATENLMPGNRYFHISNLCVLLTIYTVGILVFLGVEWWQERDKPEAFTDADIVD